MPKRKRASAESLLLSLPVEILQLITEQLDNVDTLVIWSQTCKLTRDLCRSPFGEQTFRRLLKREVIYADEARLASRILYLDLQTHAWIRPEIARWTYDGEAIDKQWYSRVLSWPASKAYGVRLDRSEEQGWIPWLFEYRVLQINHETMISQLCGEWYVQQPGKLSGLVANTDITKFENRDRFHEIYATCFYRMRPWDIMTASDEYECRGKSWGTTFQGCSDERLLRSGYLEYLCHQAEEDGDVHSAAVMLSQMIAHFSETEHARLRTGSCELSHEGGRYPYHTILRKPHRESLIEDKAPYGRTMFFVGHVASLMEKNASFSQTPPLHASAIEQLCKTRSAKVSWHEPSHRLLTLNTRHGHPDIAWSTSFFERIMHRRYGMMLSHAWHNADWGWLEQDFQRYTLGKNAVEPCPPGSQTIHTTRLAEDRARPGWRHPPVDPLDLE